MPRVFFCVRPLNIRHSMVIKSLFGNKSITNVLFDEIISWENPLFNTCMQFTNYFMGRLITSDIIN